MKRIRPYFLILLLGLFFVGCKPKYQRIILREFKQYVQTNFDDPDNLHEIVSISDSPDTIDVAKLAYTSVQVFHSELDLFDSIQNKYAITTDMPGLLGYNGSYMNKMLVLSKIKEQFKVDREYSDMTTCGLNIAGNILSDISENKYDKYYSYTIKTRVKDLEGNIKLKTFYAFQCDSVDLFEIKDRNVQPEDMPESYADLVESTTKLLIVTQSCDSLREVYVRLYKDISNLLLY